MCSSTSYILSLAVVLGFLACTGEGPVDADLFGHQDPEIEAFVQLVNDHRTSLGCERLTWAPVVARVAADHSEDMVDRSYFNHVNPDGDNPFDRLRDADVHFSRAAENIAAGQTSAQQVLGDWLNSSGHRTNIENCAYTQHGIGLVDYHWTHVFVTP